MRIEVHEHELRDTWRHGFGTGCVIGFAAAMVALLPLLTLGGCASAKKEIGHAASAAKTAAIETKAAVAGAVQTGEVGPAAMGFLKEIPAKQDLIIKAADGITDKWLPGVEDKEAWYEKLLHWWPLGIAGLIFLALAYLGLLPLVVRLAGFLFSLFPRVLAGLIPPRVHSEAKLDAEAVNGGGHIALEQSIAAKRASRPAYAAAFSYYNQKKKVRPRTPT